MSDEFEENETMELTIQDTNTLVEESKELLKSLYNLDENRVTRITTQDDLRNDVSSFISSQLQNLEHQNTLKGLLEAEIAKRVLTHELSNDELRSFYATISSEKSKNIDSLFKVFIPTQNAPNSILTPATKDEEKETFDLSPSQRQAIEKLSRIISASNQGATNDE
jgi:hypothetical protein